MKPRFWSAVIATFVACTVVCSWSNAFAATLAVTVNSTNTLTAPFLPAAATATGTGVTNSAAWSASRTVLGIPTWIEGYESLTPAANVTLDWLKGRTKAISLNQNTTFASSNVPSGSTNIQTMVVQVIGDGVSSVAFTGVSWQTVQVPVPPSGIISLYVLRARSSGVVGYAVDFTGGGSALWAVVGGVFVPSPSQDYLSFVSSATSTGTNTIFNINTDTVQVAGESLFIASNNDGVQFRVDAVSGYSNTGTKVFVDNGTFTSISSATQDVFSGFYGNSLPTDVPTTSAALAFDLDSPHILYQWDGSQWY